MFFDPFVGTGEGGGGGASSIHFLGITTTPLSNGSNTNPIIIEDKVVLAKEGDFVNYENDFYYYNGLTWQDFDGFPKLGKLAYKDNATAYYTPSGSILAYLENVGKLPEVNYIMNEEELTFTQGELPSSNVIANFIGNTSEISVE